MKSFQALHAVQTSSLTLTAVCCGVHVVLSKCTVFRLEAVRLRNVDVRLAMDRSSTLIHSTGQTLKSDERICQTAANEPLLVWVLSTSPTVVTDCPLCKGLWVSTATKACWLAMELNAVGHPVIFGGILDLSYYVNVFWRINSVLEHRLCLRFHNTDTREARQMLPVKESFERASQTAEKQKSISDISPQRRLFFRKT